MTKTRKRSIAGRCIMAAVSGMMIMLGIVVLESSNLAKIIAPSPPWFKETIALSLVAGGFVAIILASQPDPEEEKEFTKRFVYD